MKAWQWFERIAPWALPLLFILWGWGLRDPLHTIPAYADVLELTWAVAWYDEALGTRLNPLFYPQAFFPGGWHTATFAAGPAVLALLLPLHWLGGPAFAYNLAALLTFILAYAGMYCLAKRFSTSLPAAVAGMLYSFCSLRWGASQGMLNILLGSAMLPWLAWSLERGLHAPLRRRWRWFLLAGAVWALAISSSLYFVWLGGFLALAWALGRRLSQRVSWRGATAAVGLPAASALVLSAPALWLFWQASRAAMAASFDLARANFWGASLNSLPIPSLFHPFLGGLARQVYQGPALEQGAFNLGLAAYIIALLGAWAVRKENCWAPAVVLLPTGILLALGLTLKWDNESISWNAMRPVTQAIWWIGYLIKPAHFPSAEPGPPFDTAIPLPGLILAAIVPYLEQARVFARYALLAVMGIGLLAAAFLAKARRPWISAGVGLILLLELLPPPLPAHRFPPQPHPAIEWLSQHPLDGEAVMDLAAWDDQTLVLWSRGETIWSARLHGNPIVAGASSVWPAHTVFLNDWLMAHPHPFQEPAFYSLLRFYDVRYLALHMMGAGEAFMLEEARGHPQLRLAGLFDPPEQPGPWSYPIAILELMPAANPDINLLLYEGWSAGEDWGVWAMGTESRAAWIATAPVACRVELTAFPHCAPSRQQELRLSAGGREILRHRWEDCEPWSTAVDVPAEHVQVGANDLIIEAGYALSPAERTDGENPDPRRLALGFTVLRADCR